MNKISLNQLNLSYKASKKINQNTFITCPKMWAYK